jgi:hypothetical protein
MVVLTGFLTAVAREILEVKGDNISHEFSGKIPLESLSQVGKVVIGHGRSEPMETQRGFELFDDGMNGFCPRLGVTHTEEGFPGSGSLFGSSSGRS